jgi:Mg/Co/Ni transporter MgtE
MQENGQSSRQGVLARQLDYLNALGFTKLFTLISRVDPARLIELSNRADHAKILRLLTEAELDRNIHFIQTLSIDDLATIIERCPIDDLILVVREANPEEIDRFIAASGVQFNIELLLRIGAPAVLQLLAKGGSARWMPVVEAVRHDRLLHLLDELPFHDLIKLAELLTPAQLRRWFARKSVDETVLLFRYLGPENLITLLNRNGLEASIQVLDLLTTEKAILLVHEIRKMKLPRMPAREWRMLEKRIAPGLQDAEASSGRKQRGRKRISQERKSQQKKPQKRKMQ